MFNLKKSISLTIMLAVACQAKSMQDSTNDKQTNDAKREKLKKICEVFERRCEHECEVGSCRSLGYYSCLSRCENLTRTFDEFINVLTEN